MSADLHAMADTTRRSRHNLRWQDLEQPHRSISGSFTVADVLRMYKLSSHSSSDLESSSDVHIPKSRDAMLEQVLKMVRERDLEGLAEYRQPVGKKKPPSGVKGQAHPQAQAHGQGQGRQQQQQQQELIDRMDTLSESSNLLDYYISSERKLEVEEKLVHPSVNEAFRRLLRFRALPNSTFKRLPRMLPPPPPTREELMQSRVRDVYLDYYGADKPRPNYPILPPRERPPPPPEPEPKKKRKKVKKGKKKSKDKVPEDFDIMEWRKDNLPAASTALWEPWFQPKACFQQTPPSSPPPTPPSDLPQPLSYFGGFVERLQIHRIKSRPGYFSKTSMPLMHTHRTVAGAESSASVRRDSSDTYSAVERPGIGERLGLLGDRLAGSSISFTS